MKRPGYKWRVLWGLGVFLALAVYCQRSAPTPEEAEGEDVGSPAYINLHDSVAYVGGAVCRQCHADVHKTFSQTGMGSSFGPATRSKSAADFGRSQALYDPHNDLQYRPFWKGDSLHVLEYRLREGDTLHQRQERIDFIVGSGQHTNSHMIWRNGFLFQAPFTWYAQEAKLDLPPGYEGGYNTRFDRKIGLECTTCHNALPRKFVKGSINRYEEVPGAIDCERCHGPGEAHVKKIQRGEITDTSREIDYSIVNVGKLPYALQFEVCQRCHLQGNAVLAPGRSFLDFKPGMALHEVMDVYLPRYEGAEDEFIMASHVDRFRQSACVVHSGQDFNCISCHNPHLSVKATRISRFNQTCQGCHPGAPRHGCTLPGAELAAADYNCVGCHMPSSGSTDIPHVSVHDHKIQVPRRQADSAVRKKFLELAAINNPVPGPRSKALAYMQQYERFENRSFYLDSARYFLQKLGSPETHPSLYVHYHHLAGDHQAIARLVETLGEARLLQVWTEKRYDNAHAWSAYRTGQALLSSGREAKAGAFLQRAYTLLGQEPDFAVKYANWLAGQDSTERAEAIYQQALRQNKKHDEALNNLGYLYLQTGRLALARQMLERCLELHPDYLMAWLNLASLQLSEGEERAARQSLGEVLRLEPNHPRAQAVLRFLDQEK